MSGPMSGIAGVYWLMRRGWSNRAEADRTRLIDEVDALLTERTT